MNVKKKLISLILIVLIFSNLIACGKENTSNLKTQSSGSVVQKESNKEVEEPISESGSSTSDSARNVNGGQMKITLDNEEFVVNTDQNKTVEDILKSLPINLTMKRYSEHEYYSELPFIPVFDEERTSNIKAGHVYYWDGWNALVINYIDYDISPYQVVHVGEVTNRKIIGVLKNAPEEIPISVNKIVIKK